MLREDEGAERWEVVSREGDSVPRIPGLETGPVHVWAVSLPGSNVDVRVFQQMLYIWLNTKWSYGTAVMCIFLSLRKHSVEAKSPGSLLVSCHVEYRGNHQSEPIGITGGLESHGHCPVLALRTLTL